MYLILHLALYLPAS